VAVTTGRGMGREEVVAASIDPEALAGHQRWLRSAGTEGSRLEIPGLVQPGAHLAGAELAEAVLVGADLRRADLRGADLGRAVLAGADLSGADLSGADLSKADLTSARLRGARLRATRLTRADLSGANLTEADLSRSYLLRTDLSDAVLQGADLAEADLDRTIVDGTHWGHTLVTEAAGTVGLVSVLVADGPTTQTLDSVQLVEYLTSAGARISAVTPQQARPPSPLPWRWGSSPEPGEEIRG
jgi:uncharacterized protein YjbI with pentapeptide repeats